jgi:LAS superfamily LD-carboxypeptidase LdcB
MSYKENRVTVAEFGVLPGNSPLLVNVPTTPGHQQQRLHVVAANSFNVMSNAVYKDLGFPLLIASGWRPHRWVSREQYEQVLVEKYGSVAKGRLYLGFDSPHETGLTVDIGCGGLEPVSATIEKQKQTPLFKWLVENAWRFGFTPYCVEPWHWEHRISLEAYKSGVADKTTPDPVTTCADPNFVCTETVTE